MGRALKIFGCVFLGFAILGSINGKQRVTGNTAYGSQRTTEVVSLSNYTPYDLASAYASNSVAADQKFKGRRYRISGVIDSINTSLWGSAYLTMKGSVNMFSEPQFAMADNEKLKVARLSKGSMASLICTGGGDIAKTPMSNDCVFD